MKIFLLLAFIVPAFANAQDTCKLKRTTDVYTKETRLTTGFQNFRSGTTDVQISMDATGTEIDFFIWVKNDGKCFDSESSAQINFEGDRLKSNFKNTGSMNCEGAFHFNFRNLEITPSNLKRFADKRVSSIKLINGKTVTELVFTEEQKQLFQRMASCIANESKSLRK